MTYRQFTLADAEFVAKYAISKYNYDPEFGPQINMADDYGWTSSGGTPVLMWEEGPYNFGYDFTDDELVVKFLASIGWRMEAATSWCVAFYPNGYEGPLWHEQPVEVPDTDPADTDNGFGYDNPPRVTDEMAVRINESTATNEITWHGSAQPLTEVELAAAEDPENIIVHVWRFGSESSYVFGPFTESAASEFAAKVDRHPDAEVTDFSVMNSPDTFGTGAELAN